MVRRTPPKNKKVLTVHRSTVTLRTYNGSRSQQLHAFEINSGWVLKTRYGNRALTYHHRRLRMLKYHSADPTQIWVRSQKGYICLRDPLYNKKRTRYHNWCLRRWGSGRLRLSIETSRTVKAMQFDFNKVNNWNYFPTNYHFTPMNVLARTYALKSNIISNNPSRVAGNLVEVKGKAEEPIQNQYFAVKTSLRGRYRIYSAFDSKLCLTASHLRKSFRYKKRTYFKRSVRFARKRRGNHSSQLFSRDRKGHIVWRHGSTT